MGFPVFSDRSKTWIPTSQLDFISNFAEPLFTCLGELFPSLAFCASNLSSNRKIWESVETDSDLEHLDEKIQGSIASQRILPLDDSSQTDSYGRRKSLGDAMYASNYSSGNMYRNLVSNCISHHHFNSVSSFIMSPIPAPASPPPPQGMSRRNSCV